MRKSKIAKSNRTQVKTAKIVVYAEINGSLEVITEKVRQVVDNEDGRNYRKYERQFVQGNKNLQVGQSVKYGGVDCLVLKVNSQRIKLKVV